MSTRHKASKQSSLPPFISTAPEDLQKYSGDKWFASALPCAVARPRSTAEVAATLQLAKKWGVPVTARGAGCGYAGGCVPAQGGIVLSLEKMNRVIEVSASDFVAVAQAGAITGDIQAAASKKKLFYPPDPANFAECSIGGNIATNAGGPHCLKYGTTGHYILGLEVVLADGSIIRCGGRTHKNKTGFNIPAIFVGSEGMLGIVTEVTLRLLPLPLARAALSAGFASLPAAAAAIRKIFAAGHLPAAIEIADSYTLAAARAFSPHTPLPAGNAHLLIKCDGHPTAVRSELASLRKLLTADGALDLSSATTPAACDKIWAMRRTFSESLKATGLRKLNEDIVVPRSQLVPLMQFAKNLEKKYGFPVACFGHAGDGNIHVNIMVSDADQPAVCRRSRQALDALFARVLELGGTLTGEHGIGLAKLPWWTQATSPALRKLHLDIKTALDPEARLNPGKFV